MATGFFTDTTVCIGCKACEVACKQWNQLPSDGFSFTGMSYDNTVELGASTWRHVAFIERPAPISELATNSFSWLMLSDVCKHCHRAGCLENCPTGAIVRTEFDSVFVQPDVCNGCGYCVVGCPFGVIDRRIGEQGTVALEMFEEVGDLEMLVIPIGGGGLIAGNAVAARGMRPEVEIVGVEAALYPSMRNAITGANSPIGGPTLAEGIAVKNVGKLTLPVVRELVSDIILVDEAHLERAVNAYLTLQKTMAEGAGAAGLAAMLASPERFRGRRVGLILCGGNIDPRILASIMVRELEREHRIVSFRLTIADRPGVLGPIATLLGKLGANILEVDHRRLFLDVPAKGAKLDITVETRDRAHSEEILRALEEGGYQPVHISTGDAIT